MLTYTTYVEIVQMSKAYVSSSKCRDYRTLRHENATEIGKCKMVHNVQAEVVRWRHGAEAGGTS